MGVDHIGKTEKGCTRCLETKPIDSFYLVKHQANGRFYRQAQCRACDDSRRKRENDCNRERNKWRAILKKYGITKDQWEDRFSQQGSRCAVCPAIEPGWERGWVVDHDHKTGRIRGLLCVNCNLLVGHAKDNPSTLRNAAKYLETTQ